MVRRAIRPFPHTFLFSDLRGYTAYVERMGDAAARRLLQTYRGIVRRSVAREKGAEIKTEGDSFYVVFTSSASAVRCGIAIQRTAARRRKDVLEIGIGIHAGEVLPFDHQYVGGAVNIAARLAAAAGPGEILISETVRGLMRTAVRVRLEDRGLLMLKGVAEPIQAYAIRVAPVPLPHPAVSPASPMEAVLQGQLEEAIRLSRALPRHAPADLHCDALTAMAVVTASHGDLEGALYYTERLLRQVPRAADPSWARAAYALRAWLYSLVRQPGEAQAELARVLERPGTSLPAVIFLLLAITIAGQPAHAEELLKVAAVCAEAPCQAACAAVAAALQGRIAVEEAGRALVSSAGPFLADLIALQLAARTGKGATRQPKVTHPGAGPLAAMIFRAAQ